MQKDIGQLDKSGTQIITLIRQSQPKKVLYFSSSVRPGTDSHHGLNKIIKNIRAFSDIYQGL